MRLVGFVPGVFKQGEGGGGVFGAENEVAFSVVGFEICIPISRDSS